MEIYKSDLLFLQNKVFLEKLNHAFDSFHKYKSKDTEQAEYKTRWIEKVSGKAKKDQIRREKIELIIADLIKKLDLHEESKHKELKLADLSNKDLLLITYFANLKNILSSHHRDVTDDVTTALNMAARKRGIVEYDFPYLKGKKQVDQFIKSAKDIVAAPEEYLSDTKRNDRSVLQNITPKKIVISGAALTTFGLITGSILDKTVRQNTVDGVLGISAFTFYNIFIDNLLHIAILFPVGVIFGALTAATITPFRNTKKEEINVNEELQSNIENDNVIKLNKAE